MNRAFKTIFHNGESDRKAIVTMSIAVNNGKRFKNLNYESRQEIIKDLEYFTTQVKDFIEDLKSGKYQNNEKI